MRCQYLVSSVSTAALLLLLGVARGDDGPPTEKIGTKIDNLTLQTVTGKPFPLRDGTATVVVFLSLECPVSNSYAGPLSELAKSYEGKGVRFLGVCVNDDLDGAELARQVQEFHYAFPVVRDEGHAAADAFK